MAVADALELARVWSASLPPVFDFRTDHWRPWNGRALSEWECTSAFNAFYQARRRGEPIGAAVQAAYEWLSEHAWPEGRTCTRDGRLVGEPAPMDE